ncbi:MAG: hypothetical protein QXS66_08610 [Thermoproteota archaeon]
MKPLESLDVPPLFSEILFLLVLERLDPIENTIFCSILLFIDENKEEC